MTKQELLKYAGKKTFGKNTFGNTCVLLTNGIVVAYDPNFDEECLVARFEHGDVSNSGWSSIPYKIIFFTKEEEELYKSGKGCYLFAKIDNVIMDEQKELDLTELLEGREGVELWSNVFGLCKLERIIETVRHPIVLSVTNNVGVNISECISKDGLYNNAYNGECILWPSENNRDWSTFKKPLKVNDDDWVVALTYTDKWFTVCKYGDLDITKNWKYIIPYNKFDITLNGDQLKKLSIV